MIYLEAVARAAEKRGDTVAALQAWQERERQAVRRDALVREMWARRRRARGQPV